MPATLKVTRVAQSRLTESLREEAPFGSVFADHMLVADYAQGRWGEPEIRPYGPVAMSPALTALHYGQSIFEGFKAYRALRQSAGPGPQVGIFRMRDNHLRLNRGAARLCMPAVPEDIFTAGIAALVQVDREWVPAGAGSALYIRPIYFATDEALSVKPSATYRFVVITSPVPPYFSGTVSLRAEERYVRAFPGGTGDIKPAGNYAGALLAAQEAQADGFQNVLWLDGIDHRWIEEGGLMNVVFAVDGALVTPPLGGTILPGIVRDSFLTLAREAGVRVEERPMAIEELFDLHAQGRLTEGAGVGTGVAFAPLGRIRWRDREIDLTPNGESLLGRIGQRLEDIRTGRTADTHGWMTFV
ncbi:MAG: branched-chain amino acid aminotransferase [Vicinamibacterales bacterium]